MYCWPPQKIIFEKIKKDTQKRRISCWFQKCWKICTEMYQKFFFSIFQLLLKIQKLYLLITFNRGMFWIFFNTFGISVKFCVFWCPYWSIRHKKFSALFFGHYEVKLAHPSSMVLSWSGRRSTYMRSRVKRFWTFLRKWRTQTLWCVPNQILKHFYKTRFWLFWAVSAAFGLKVCKKC